ncbi:MAG: hypothetical protein QOJ15_6102 [Bradyrhizobium sp.]|jgi:hypothetical protein|nr:hypothetical protein [Bradyrhizobium sp.]
MVTALHMRKVHLVRAKEAGTGRHDAGRSVTRCRLFGLRSDKAGTTPPRGLCVVNSIATRGPLCDQR